MLHLLIFSCEVHKLIGAESNQTAAPCQRLLTSYSAVTGKGRENRDQRSSDRNMYMRSLFSIVLPLPPKSLSLLLFLCLSVCLSLSLSHTHTLSFLQWSLTYLPSGLSGSQSSWLCQKYFVLRVSLINRGGRGPKMASIIAKCSRLS